MKADTPDIRSGAGSAEMVTPLPLTWQVRGLAGVLRLIYNRVLRRAAREALEGRLLDPGDAERGRWLRADMKGFLRAVWKEVDVLLPSARLDRLPTVGNRHNVFLAVVTTAAYRCLLQKGVERKYAMSLVGDMGWKVYARLLALAGLPFRLFTRNRQLRMDRTLRALMIFPFSTPGKPGYQAMAWPSPEGFHTHWTHCPPQAFARQVDRTDNNGELEAFYQSWCLYDWAAADALAGDGRKGHYSRPKTLSRGDAVCDMCWYAERPQER